ncbi:HAMP domain-containing histidine kinase [Eubacteriales bacterium OttesenSCG-928-K08]|nr:HAMP domain-containing histidine kinase [Eubacteriales bacterium OttesenSCG-928-K08]
MKRLMQMLFNKDLNLRVRVFNVLALVGGTLGIIAAFSGALAGLDLPNILVNLAASAVAAVLLWYSSYSGRYQLCYMITIVVVFLLFFPILFFTSGGYYSGMAAYFVFAMVFTAFMLDGKKLYITMGLEIAVYCATCLLGYYKPELIIPFDDEWSIMLDNIIGFLVAGIALSIVMLLLLRMYKGHQQLLEERNAALEELDRMKTQFLGDISHELKTPITAMSGYAQLLQKGLKELPVQQALAAQAQQIASEAENLTLKIGRVLDMTAIEEDRFQIVRKPCYVDEIIHGAIAARFSVLNKNDSRLEVRVPSGLPPVLADDAAVARVILNLLSNAARHTKAGNIIVFAQDMKDFISITVQDDGEGIDATRLPYVFERYHTVAQGGGTGLGLFVCKHIVEKHGGQIHVESEPNKGTKAVFTLPVSTTPC